MAAVKDVVSIDDRWYVLATSSRTDDRTRVLKHDDLFALFDRWGDIQHIGLGEQGLYYQGTRFLSHCELTINERRPLLLNSTVQEDNCLMVVDLTTPDLYEGDVLAIPKGTLHLFRARLLWEGVFYERLRLCNYGDRSATIDLDLTFGADFSDIFEVRGISRQRRGELLPTEQRSRRFAFGYRGLDSIERRTRVEFNHSPQWRDGQTARFAFTIPPAAEQEVSVTVTCETGTEQRTALPYEQVLNASRTAMADRRAGQAQIFTSNEQFNDWLNRSTADLHMLTTLTDKGDYPYAGVPWFSTPFGRDGLITAMQMLWLNPRPARGVLSFLAAHQADREDSQRDAEPGKILHEMRGGEMATLAEIPFARYYGSADSTPLFVMLAGAYYRRCPDPAFARMLWPNIRRALEWIDRYGDSDGDGFVEYRRHTPDGLVHQGWKDSADAIFHHDGSPAEGPIALCEVQGYVYAAKLAAAELARVVGDDSFADALTRQALDLKTRFNDAFWCDDIQTYALALDGRKRPCRVRSSNAGHVLATGIADEAHAALVAQTLLSKNSFNGWGVRTIADSERRYNPMSYHNGSIWPHDNAMIAAGLARYGRENDALTVMTGLFDASIALDLHRLPELFCGFERRPGQGPTLYPVACAPQAWAAGAVFQLLQACLGLSFAPEKPQLRFYHPRLPDYLHRVEITNLQIGNGTMDLTLHRHPRDVGVSVVRKEGDIDIAVIV